MAKPKVVLAEIVRPDGRRVAIKNGTIARAIEERDDQLNKLTLYLESARKEINASNQKLGQLQNHWWTRFGEALGFVQIKPKAKKVKRASVEEVTA